jgi:hypothetical protein
VCEMSIRKGEDQPTPGVLSELQNVGADSKGLSSFLAFWRSATTPPVDPPSDRPAKPRAWFMVDVSPVRRVKRRRSILDTLFSALKTLATQPAFGVDPVQAHDYGLPNDLAALRRPTDTTQLASVATQPSAQKPPARKRVRHVRLSRASRSRRMVGASRRDI